jgi:glycosyltransferase involved in cell wall biosynthesis
MRIRDLAYGFARRLTPAAPRRLFRRLFFWLPFLSSWLVGQCRRIVARSDQCSYDLLFVMDKLDKNWILGAICREIANGFPGKVGFYYGEFYNVSPFWPWPIKLPAAKAYFFAQEVFLLQCLKASPAVWPRPKFVWYTHPQELGPTNECVFALNRATKIVSTCSLFVDALAEQGVQREKLSCVLGAADPDFFCSHQRSADGLIGFCTAFYERKNPDLILELAKALPNRSFVLLGRDWHRYARFPELNELPNFQYVNVPYKEYPKYYEKMSVFVSASNLEGGPIPLVEAMMSNTVPVASRTGFAPDLIKHGRNGFLFDVGSPVKLIGDLITQAFAVQTDIRATVEHLSWRNFSLQMNAVMAESASKQISEHQVSMPEVARGSER